MTIEDVARLVNRVANVATVGGRCTVLDSTRCALYDCSNWSAAMSHQVLHLFPTCAINVSAYTGSASGFVVFFQLNEAPNRIWRLITLLSVIFALGICTWYVGMAVQRVVESTVSFAPKWVVAMLTQTQT